MSATSYHFHKTGVTILPHDFRLPLRFLRGIRAQIDLNVGGRFLSVGQQRQVPHMVHHHPKHALRKLKRQFQLSFQPPGFILRHPFPIYNKRSNARSRPKSRLTFRFFRILLGVLLVPQQRVEERVNQVRMSDFVGTLEQRSYERTHFLVPLLGHLLNVRPSNMKSGS